MTSIAINTRNIDNSVSMANDMLAKSQVESNNKQSNVQKEQSLGNKNAQDEEKLVEAIQKTDKALNKIGFTLKYEKHEETNRMIISVVDKASNKVIKEIPSKKLLDLAVSICEHAGLFIDKKR